MGEEQLGRGGDIPQEVARDRARLTHQAIERVKGGLAYRCKGPVVESSPAGCCLQGYARADPLIDIH